MTTPHDSKAVTPDPLQAGVAKAVITTDAKGALIHDPLHAKALVLDDGRTAAVILALDALAIGGIGDIPDDFLPALRSRIQSELGIPGCHVLVNASHTHPPGRILCGPDDLLDRTFNAVRQAFQNRVPVTAGSGSGHEDRISMNRTLRLKNGKDWTIRHANPGPPDEDVAGVGPLDPEIGLLRIDRLDGRPLAVVYNFACHPLFGNTHGAITANYPGVASAVLEENLGHEAMALFLQGAGGDIVDVRFKDFTRPRDITPLGVQLGLSALTATRGIPTRKAGLSVISETLELPRRTDIPGLLVELEKEQEVLLGSLGSTSLNFKTFLPMYLRHALSPDFPADDSYRYWQDEKTGSAAYRDMDAYTRKLIAKYLGNIRAMEQLARIRERIATFKFHQELNAKAGVPTIPAEVQGIKIGDFVLIAFPAELLAEVGLNVKQASPYPHTFLAAFSNGYIHYGAPAAAYSRGGYEVTECLLAPEWQALFENKAADLIRRL